MKLIGLNKSGEDIPPYAVVSLVVDESGKSGMVAQDDGTVQMSVFKCREIDEHLQNPALLAIAGQNGIRKGVSGEISQSWPSLVRLSSTVATIGSGVTYAPIKQGYVNLGDRVGVRDGDWGVIYHSGGAFSYIGPVVNHNGTQVGKTGSGTNVSLGLVSGLASMTNRGGYYATFVPGTIYHHDSMFTNATSSGAWSLVLVDQSEWWVQIRFSGVYVVAWHASVELGDGLGFGYASSITVYCEHETEDGVKVMKQRVSASIPAYLEDVYNNEGATSHRELWVRMPIGMTWPMMCKAGDRFRLVLDAGTDDARVGVAASGLNIWRTSPYYVAPPYLLSYEMPT